jgi:plastocyanin
MMGSVRQTQAGAESSARVEIEEGVMRGQAIRVVAVAVFAGSACSPASTPAPQSRAPSAVAVSQPGLVSVTGRAPRGAAVALVPSGRTDMAPASGPVMMDQRGQQFIPSVLLARVGQAVEFRNGEAIPHNVYVTRNSGGAAELNVSTDPGQSYTHTFTEAGAYEVSCDIHPSMRAALIVVDTPFAALADDFGAFLIMNVPPGAYEMVTVLGDRTTTRAVEVNGEHVDLGAS